LVQLPHPIPTPKVIRIRILPGRVNMYITAITITIMVIITMTTSTIMATLTVSMTMITITGMTMGTTIIITITDRPQANRAARSLPARRLPMDTPLRWRKHPVM